MTKKKILAGILLTILTVCTSTACAGPSPQEEPVTVTLWHVYGGQADSPLNTRIEEFNDTVGVEENIRVQVTSVTNTNTIHENVLSSAFEDPGAPKLPDMFVSYPKTVMAMPDDQVLVDYQDYFSKEELEEFIPAFLEEGRIEDRLEVLPIAKSTEIMFVNKTAFDRFSEATGAQMSQLNTWEGLYGLIDDYRAWTDSLTPEVEGDGKCFFAHDYHFNYFQVGTESLGEDFFQGEQVAFGPAFEQVWEPYARGALQGGVWLESGYATEPLRTGDAIVTVASSASVLYYTDEVTYPDNTSEKVEIIALPCPVFEKGEKLVMQRGAGICTVKSTKEREEACITFLKWLTDPEHNVDFVTEAGYMPVKQEAFEKYLVPAMEKLEDPMYRSLYEAFLQTREEYEFYTAPKLNGYLDLETRFEEQVRKVLAAGRKAQTGTGDPDETAIQKAREEFESAYMG